MPNFTTTIDLRDVVRFYDDKVQDREAAMQSPEDHYDEWDDYEPETKQAIIDTNEEEAESFCEVRDRLLRELWADYADEDDETLDDIDADTELVLQEATLGDTMRSDQMLKMARGGGPSNDAEAATAEYSAMLESLRAMAKTIPPAMEDSYDGDLTQLPGVIGQAIFEYYDEVQEDDVPLQVS